MELFMNSSPEHIPSQAQNPSSSESKIKPINDLINLLLDQQPSQDTLSLEKNKNNLAQELNLSSEVLETQITDLESDSTVKEAESPELNSNGTNGTSSPYPDIDVDIEPPTTSLTLEEAIEYEAFLRKTVEPQPESEVSLDKIKINSVEQDSSDLETSPSESENLVDSVNSLIPLIVELLKYKLNDSTEAIIQTVTPVLDQLIEQRSADDSQKMAAAIAKILPSAITEEMNLSPEAIAKAIAPEIAIAIKEQIRLDKNAVAQALGSQMGNAIKAQIKSEEGAMEEALYPIIGNTIRKSMVELVREINNQAENKLSPEGIMLKIRAKMQGVSEEELILAKSISKGYHVQAIFLIAKDSGLVIQEVINPQDHHLDSDSDMIAGMLTAIRSFANDCITFDAKSDNNDLEILKSELESINYGDSQILIEVPGAYYLAVVYKGDPPKKFRDEIHSVLSKIALDYGDEIKNYQGNPATVPAEIELLLKQLIQPEDQQPKKSSSPPMLVWLLLLLLGMIFIPWSIVNYRAWVASNIERITVDKLYAAPELLSVYRLEHKVKKGKLTVTGSVPNQYLHNQVNKIIQTIAEDNKLQPDNQITVVNVPINPSLYAGEIRMLTRVFNLQSGILIETDYEPTTLTIEGFVLNPSDKKYISQAFKEIPGIKQVIFRVADKLPTVEEHIYFKRGSNQFNLTDNSSKIEAVKQFLEQYPQLNLKLVAHTDNQGSIKINQKLRQERCQNVQAALVATGVDSTRLITQCEQQHPLEKDNQTLKSKRYVGFEPFISKQ